MAAEETEEEEGRDDISIQDSTKLYSELRVFILVYKLSIRNMQGGMEEMVRSTGKM